MLAPTMKGITRIRLHSYYMWCRIKLDFYIFLNDDVVVILRILLVVRTLYGFLNKLCSPLPPPPPPPHTHTHIHSHFACAVFRWLRYYRSIYFHTHVVRFRSRAPSSKRNIIIFYSRVWLFKLHWSEGRNRITLSPNTLTEVQYHWTELLVSFPTGF